LEFDADKVIKKFDPNYSFLTKKKKKKLQNLKKKKKKKKKIK